MLQIGTVIIGYPDWSHLEKFQYFKRECDLRRLNCMQRFGINITLDELTEEKWRDFYTNEYNQKKYEEILVRRGEA
jgi:hypothetical protein